MAKIKVSELSELTNVPDSSYLIVDNGTSTNKVTKSNLLNDSGFLTEEDIDIKLGGKSFVCITQEEYDNLSSEEKNRDDIIYQIMDAELSYNDLVDTPNLDIYATKEELKTADVGSVNGIKLQMVTQAEYNALNPRDPNTFYIITD